MGSSNHSIHDSAGVGAARLSTELKAMRALASLKRNGAATRGTHLTYRELRSSAAVPNPGLASLRRVSSPYEVGEGGDRGQAASDATP